MLQLMTFYFFLDYSCALQRDILIQGRMYISLGYVCFYANILKWETNVNNCQHIDGAMVNIWLLISSPAGSLIPEYHFNHQREDRQSHS